MQIKKLLTTTLTLLFVSSITFAADVWQAVGDVGFSDGAITYGSIVVDASGTPSVAYVDGGSGGAYAEYAIVKTFNGSAWVNSAPNVVNSLTSTTWYTSLAINSSGGLYVAFKDMDYFGKISVRRVENGTWTNTGPRGFTPGYVFYISLAIDGSGTPYVAYEDGANGSKASVMKWTGSAWTNVGIAGFSAGSANYTSLAIDASGTPYVAYKDNANSSKVTVMKYNGSSWVNVGSAGFSAATAYDISLKIDGSGTPYVAYRDNGNSAKATVMKYDGTSWVNVGSAGFSADAVLFTSLAIDSSDSLYVAFQDHSTADQKATVMKFDGSSWRILGPANFSAGQVEHLSLAVTGTGTPYMVYRDNGNGGKTTVMQFVVTEDPVVTNNNVLTLDEGATAVIDSTVLLTTDGDTDPAALTYTVTVPSFVGEIKLSGTATSTFTQADINNNLVTFTHDGSEWHSPLWFAFVVSDGNFQTTTQQFTFSVTAVNDVPTITENAGLTLNPGVITATIDSTVLQAVDEETGQTSLIITITALPTNGTLQNNGVDIALNGTFNQSDLFNNLITYTYDEGGAISDEFTFSVSDGTDELTDQVFNITIIDVAWEVHGTAGFSASYAYNTSLKVDSSGTPYVAYHDFSSTGLAVMKFDGSAWVYVGSVGFSAGSVGTPSLALDPSGTPFVAYKDGGNSNKATTMKFDGSAWVGVGNAGFSTGACEETSLAIDGSGTPYVAYKEGGYYGGVTVMKYNGSSWEAVGNAEFSAGQANEISLAIHGNGTPYVAYQYNGFQGKATVMKYNGSSWETVGSAEFSAGQARNIDLVFDENNTAYVAYYDGSYSSKATVMKYDGTAWVNVGTPGFSEGAAYYESLAFDAAGTPHIAFYDNANSAKATVMKFDGTEWILVGGAGFSAGSASYTSLAIDNNDALFLAFQDGANGSKATVMQNGWTPPNQTPSIATNTGLILDEGAVESIATANLAATDAESDDGTLIFTITTNVANGEVQLSGSATTTFTQADINAGNVTYVHDGSETTDDSFTFSVNDGAAELTGQTFSFTITPVNDLPVNTVAPALSGTATQNEQLTITNGTWTDGEEDVLNFSYQWYADTDGAGYDGSAITNATNSTYTLTNDEVGLYIYAVVTANDGSANVTANSNYSGSIVNVNDAPVNTTAPALSGSAIQNELLSVDEGTWSDIDGDALSFAYQWYSDTDAAGYDGAMITDATDSTYILTNGDVDNYLYAVVTANDGSANVTANSDYSSAVVDVNDAPENTVAPAITGTATEDEQLSVNNGTWTDLEGDALIFAYQWYSDSNGADYDGTAIAEATDSTFTPTDDQVGHYLYAIVTANDGYVDVAANSDYSNSVINVNDAPVNTTAPALSGTATEDELLSVNSGSWTDDDGDVISFTYQWYFDNDGADYDGSAITDATDSTFTPTNDDVGLFLYAIITANDGYVDVAANSDYSNSVINVNDAPVNTTAPALSGTATEDELLSVNSGSWTDDDGDALTYTYQWYFDTDGTDYDGTAITDATDSTFTPTNDDVGIFLYAIITANDGYVDVTANSDYSNSIINVNDAPVNSTTPVLSGTTTEGDQLSVSSGDWTDDDGDALTFTFQWYSDDDSLDVDGAEITGATDSTYTLTAADVNMYLYAVVTADDGNGGSVSANSNYSDQVNSLSTEDDLIPAEYSLSQNYPNPFNPSTTFNYGLKEDSDVVLEVYTLLGQKVMTLVNEKQPAGYHKLQIDMSGLSSGVYLYRLQAGRFVKNKKFILLK